MNSDQYSAALDRFNGHLDRFNEKMLKAMLLAAPPLFGGLAGATLTAFLFETTTTPHLLSFGLGAALGFFVYVTIKFLIRNPHIPETIMQIIMTVIAILVGPFLIKLIYRCVINFNASNVELETKLITIAVLLGLLAGCLTLIYKLPDLLKRLFSGKTQQAYSLFILSMAALGWGLWLQNGGNWQGMAALNIPFVLPLLDWSIPWTESIGFPFALLGYIHDPAGAVVSGIAQAHSGEIVALLGAATLLLLFAKAQLKNAGTPLHPALPLLTLALLLASVCLDIALHWSGAPALHPAMILFNRAFSVLALGVLLFWWGNIPIGGEDVPGAESDMGIARGKAAMRALKICFWCVGLVFVMTAASHFSGEWRHGIRLILVGLWMVPARMAINFPNDYRDDLQQYRKAKQMWEQSYSPARIVPTKAEIDNALGD